MSVFPKEIVCATSTKADGNMGFRFGKKSEVIANRTQFLEKHSSSFQDCIPMNSEHGELIKVVDGQSIGRGITSREGAIEADVLVTQEKNCALLLTTADCQAVSFYDPQTHTIALAHISRHTLALGLAQKTVGFLRQTFNTKPANLLIHISPHIKNKSYKFKTPLEKIAPLMKPFIQEKDGYAYIDTVAACLHQLTKAGVTHENITISEIDTATSLEHFSYYVATRDKSPDARMATILAQR